MAYTPWLVLRKVLKLMASSINHSNANLIGFPGCAFGPSLPQASPPKEISTSSSQFPFVFLTFNFEKNLDI